MYFLRITHNIILYMLFKRKTILLVSNIKNIIIKVITSKKKYSNLLKFNISNDE